MPTSVSRFATIVVLALLASLATAVQAAPAETPALVPRPADKSQDVLGFDVVLGGQTRATVQLSSQGTIRATKMRRLQSPDRLILSGLSAKEDSGLSLAADDFVEVRQAPGDDFPEVRFRLTVAGFDRARWEKAVGQSPFHFLDLCLPGAEVFHQRGWILATPVADPFPLLGDVHAGTPEIAAEWSHNWSYTVPIGGYPIPVVGLWSPSKKLYVGYDFMESRLAEQSERYLATAYCWKENDGPSAPGQFVTLVFPYGGRGYQKLLYPEAGTVIAGRFRLVASTQMPATEDPNALLQSRYFRKYADQFPRVPANSDMGWLPGGVQLKQLPGPPQGPLVVRLPQGNPYEEPGTVEIGGWTAHRESQVTAAFRRNDRGLIERLKRDIAYLKTKAQRVTIDGDDCLFWPKPLEGKWRDLFGGEAVKTLHNANGWAAGLALVDFYRHDKTAEYLPLIDGIYQWTRHFVWTRNEFADVPSSPFAIGGTLSAAFLLDYYFAFKDDPQRAESARQALDLARKITYRYMVAWASDSDHDDNLDSAFLWEPNSGRDWTATACANEVHWNLDTLTQVYVNSGDPILNYYLRGALEHWHLLYQDLPAERVADYSHDALSEWYGLFDGTMAGRGGRATFGTADILPLHDPVGDSLLRVTCGIKAAFACTKGGQPASIADYRYSPDVNFSFRVRTRHAGPMDLTLSFPFADLTGRTVACSHKGSSRTLVEGKDLRRSADAPSYIYVRGVENDDVLTVGQVAADAPVLEIGNPWTRADRPLAAEDVADFHTSGTLPGSVALPSDWRDTDSYAGLWPGRHWAWSIPWDVSAAPGAEAPLASTAPYTIHRSGSTALAAVYVFFSPRTTEGAVAAQLTGSGKEATIAVHASQCAIAWRSWPACFHQKVLVAKIAVPAWAESIRITPQDSCLLGVTTLQNASGEKGIDALLARGNAELQTLLARQQSILRLRKLAADVPEGRIAVLPAKNLTGPVAGLMMNARLWKKCRLLKPEDLLDKSLFNAKTFPVLMNLGAEEYAGTIHRQGDGAEAITNYLRSGGFLVMLTSEPLPFCYDGWGPAAKPYSLTPRLGVGVGHVFEKPPEGTPLTFGVNPAQRILSGLPASFPFFTEGDLRLRTMRRNSVSPDAEYTPIISVTGPEGKAFGEAAAYVRFVRGPFTGAQVLYVWSRLSSDKEIGPALLEHALRFITSAAGATSIHGVPGSR